MRHYLLIDIFFSKWLTVINFKVVLMFYAQPRKPGSLTYVLRNGKDPGSARSRDFFKNRLVNAVVEVSNYMLPHASYTFEIKEKEIIVAKGNINFVI